MPFLRLRLIQFSFTTATLNQLEEKGARALKAKFYHEAKEEKKNKIYYRFDVSLSRDFSWFCCLEQKKERKERGSRFAAT